MPVLSVGEIKYMITLHKKISYNFFFYEILHWEIFQAILGKFRGNSDWGLGRIRPQIGSKKTTAIISEGLHNSVLCSSHAQPFEQGGIFMVPHHM